MTPTHPTARERAEAVAREIVRPINNGSPHFGNLEWRITSALLEFADGRLDEVLRGIDREQNYREYRCDEVGDQDGSGIAACKEIRGWVKRLKSTESGEGG